MTITKRMSRSAILIVSMVLIAACSQSATPQANFVPGGTLVSLETEVPITALFSMTEFAIARTQVPYASNTPVNSVDNAAFNNNAPTLPPTWTVIPGEPTQITATPLPQTQVAVVNEVTATHTPSPVVSATSLEPTFTYTPSNTPPPTVTPANVVGMTETEIRAYLQRAPLIYSPVTHMRKIYENGQTFFQRDASAIIGVGDCNTAHRYFLKPLHPDNTDEMGVDMSFLDSDDMQLTLSHFEESFENTWVSAHVGYNAFSVLDAFSTSAEECDPNESPLDCDIRRYKPMAAFIMFGPNDLNVLTSEEYEDALRLIIESTIAQGVIPIMSTFVYSDEYGDKGFKAERHNAIILALAYEYQIPFVNLWLATQDLDFQGIHTDNAHLRPEGLNERNRLAIEILNVIRKDVIYSAAAVAVQAQTR